jgi:hypothetical protein
VPTTACALLDHLEATIAVRSGNGGMRQRLSAAQVAELAELLDDAPRRAGVVDEVLQAAAESRGMMLLLAEPGCPAGKRASRRASCGETDADVEYGRRT